MWAQVPECFLQNEVKALLNNYLKLYSRLQYSNKQNQIPSPKYINSIFSRLLTIDKSVHTKSESGGASGNSSSGNGETGHPFSEFWKTIITNGGLQDRRLKHILRYPSYKKNRKRFAGKIISQNFHDQKSTSKNIKWKVAYMHIHHDHMSFSPRFTFLASQKRSSLDEHFPAFKSD